MKKIFALVLVAALAAALSAQTLVGGGEQSSSSNNSSKSIAFSAGSINAHAWFDTRVESLVQTETDRDQLKDADGVEKDASVTPQLKGEMGARALFGDVFYVKAMGFYNVNRDGFSSATIMAGPGAQIGTFSIGANVGTDLTNFKGIKIGADASWEVVSETSIFAWGNTVLNGGKNKVISTSGVYSDGKRDYTAWDAGIGVDSYTIQGLYLGAIASVWANNNEWNTKSGNKLITTTDILGKIGFVQDGRVLFVGLGYRGGEKIINAASDPRLSQGLIAQIGFKLQ